MSVCETCGGLGRVFDLSSPGRVYDEGPCPSCREPSRAERPHGGRPALLCAACWRLRLRYAPARILRHPVRHA